MKTNEKSTNVKTETKAENRNQATVIRELAAKRRAAQQALKAVNEKLKAERARLAPLFEERATALRMLDLTRLAELKARTEGREALGKVVGG